MRTITLLDGEHELHQVTFYALDLMNDYNVTFDGTFSPKTISGMLAAILTDSEPFVDGAPAKTWTPAMAAKVMPPSKVDDIISTLTALLDEAFPDSDGKAADDRPTKARAGSK